MTKRLKRGAGPTYPMWMRSLALACLLFVGLASSVQAIHIHGQWLPQNASKATAPADASQLPGGEEHCPLCIAMHSALPVSSRIEPVRLVPVGVRLAHVVNHAPDSHWHFALFSRPPPTAETV